MRMAGIAISFCIAAEIASYAMYIFANIVSPPTGGVLTHLNRDPIEGTRVKDMSEWH